MKHCDALIFPRWCAPVEPAGTVLTEHAVAVSDGRIQDLLPVTEAQAKYQASVTLERPDHLLIPGLVNAHTHAAMTLLRGVSDDLPLKQWLEQGIWPAEKQWVSAEFVRDGTELAIAEMLSSGTTCFSDQYFFPEVVAETANELHMRAMVGTPVIEFETAWARNTDEYLDKASDLVHDPYSGHPLIRTCFAPHSTYALKDEHFIELRTRADQIDCPVQIHLHESAEEVDSETARTGKRPFERLEELGLVNASLLAVHAVHMLDTEIERMAAAGVSIAHCPKSNLKLASGVARAQAYRDAGITVGIGTDGAASNNTLDMLSEIQTTALLAKAAASSASAVSADDALRMATLDSARAIGLASEIGSIEAGKWADLTCIDLGTLNSQPCYDPVSQLVYTAGSDQVSDVWVAGRHLVAGGELTHIKPESILARANEWQDRIAQGAADQV